MRGTFRQFEIFLAVAEKNSFSAGSEHLNISQAAVSKQIAALEKALGECLFFRRPGYAVSLTPRGKKLFNELPAMLDHVSRVAKVERRNVLVKIGAASIILDKYFYPHLAEFAYQNPDITLQFEELCSEEEAIAALGKSNLDLLFYTFTELLPPSRGSFVNIASSGLFAAPEQVAQISALLRGNQPIPMVMPLEGTDDDAAHQKVLRSMGVAHLKVVARAQRITARIDIAARGLGVCLAPLSVTQKDINEGRISRVGEGVSHAYRYCFFNERTNGETVEKVRKFLVGLIS